MGFPMFSEGSAVVSAASLFELADGAEGFEGDLAMLDSTTLAGDVDDLTELFDRADLSPIQRLKLTREVATIRQSLAGEVGRVQRLRLAARLAEVRRELLGAGALTPAAAPAPIAAPTSDPTEEVASGRRKRVSTSGLYDYDPNRKPAQRKRENAEAMDLLAKIDSGEIPAGGLTEAQKATLARYSGTGGNLIGADGKKGSAYEYYTPKPIAEGMWTLLQELGFAGGRVLDPAGGVGIFGATAPTNAAVDAVELNETSGRVNQLINDGPGFSTTIAPFERVAAATPDETYDAVVTNVPFGGVADRGGNQLLDTKYRDEPIQNYFILRSLEKLRPGGLAAFITPPRCVSGKGGKEEDLRVRASYLAEFMGAYRLPNAVFGTASADTITDVIVFRKYGRDTLTRIQELRETAPGLLVEANVMWQPFINGMYFADEGRRFVLGEFQAKDPNKFRDVDRVINDGTMTDIAKLLRKFGESRVRWDVLEAAETTPIVYRDGDTMQHAGRTLQLLAGQWVEIAGAANGNDAQAAAAETLASLSTPLGAVNAAVSLASANAVQLWLIESARALDVPDWLRFVLGAVAKLGAGDREKAWNACTVGLAIDQAMEERQAEESGFDYLSNYPVLSEAMRAAAASSRSPDAALPASLKTAIRKVGIHYSKADGYSGVWRGDVAKSIDMRTEVQRFEAERYQAGGTAFVPLDRAREVFGASFDPIGTDEWCISGDGASVARADDYFVGNYADFLARINADIAASTDDRIRAKLLRQKQAAQSRVVRSDPSAMSFNLFSPFVRIEEKAEFVRRFVDPRFAVAFDDETGKPYIECSIGTPKNEAERNLKRFAEYLRTGTVATRTSKADKEDDPTLEKQRLTALRAIVRQSEAQFNSWVKSNRVIMGRLEDIANDPARIYFRQVEDDSPLDIPGLNPEWKTHGYQAAWVRKAARDFSGINGDGVGLGKTSQGLIAIQHAQSIGVKKKTMIVVPNAVLSNWRKEAGRVYASTDDCLFVGLRASTDGTSFKTDPSSYDADLNRVLENRHAKIFVTYEAFQRLRLREQTAEAYDKHLAAVDASYAESDLKKKDERAKGFRAALIERLTKDKAKSAAAPFFEDLGVDSLVIDEAHMLKNSRATVEFTGGKFLSLAEPSARGLDAQAKAWYIRKDAPRKDGVILLTATPITNSPLEIYSMLSLAVGDERINGLMMGVRGSDEFMAMMCELEDRDEETMDGLVKPYKVFTGLANVTVLRTALSSSATMRDAQDVGAQIVMPEADETPTPVGLPREVVDQLKVYKEGFRFAIDTLMEKNPPRGSAQAYNQIAAKFGEPMELIGHPFNLINKMTMLIADPELDQRASFYVISPAQEAKAAALVQSWNAKAPVEDRARKGPHTDEEAIVGRKTVKDGEDKTELLRVAARAKVAGARIVLDSMQPDVQAAFEAAAEAAGVDLDCSVPPKLAALVENFQREEANPRGRVEGLASGRVRQLIFCDVLALHSKIKRLLMKRCGVAAGAIAIITGSVNGKPEQILEVQDGFNADGETNRYRVVIANEKAEVGINLQKGTQAIHHLTLGWTPDSLTQRNGRGVRQGNQTERVRVYRYDADGTFDTYKRVLVGKKATWIDALMNPEGGDRVNVTGGLTREQMESMIDSVGDADAVTRAQERAESAERLARAATAKGKQAVALQTIKAQNEFLGRYPDAKRWAADKVRALVRLQAQITDVRARGGNPRATAAAVLRNQGLLAELEAREVGLRRDVTEALSIKGRKSWSGDTTPEGPATLDELLEASARYGGRKTEPADAAANMVLSGYNFEVTVNENSGIAAEWRSERDMAASMIEQSRKDFERTAGEQGAYAVQVLSAADQDAAVVIDGKVVCAGAFIERDGSLGLVRKEQRGGLITTFIDPEGDTNRMAASDAIRKGSVTLPGEPGYQALIAKAAEIEDAIAARGPISDSRLRDALFSNTMPDVAMLRRTESTVAYSGALLDLQLGDPYFPWVVPPSAAIEGAGVLRKIVAQQADIVKNVTANGPYALRFEARSEFKVRWQYGVSQGSFWRLLSEFGRANGVKVTRADLDGLAPVMPAGSPWTSISMRTSMFDPAVDAPDAKDEASLSSSFVAWMTDKLLPDFDLSSDPLFRVDPLAFAEANYPLAAKAYILAVAKLALGSDASLPPTPVAASSTTGLTGMVGITGETRRWKDVIKSFATQAGGRAVWDGTAECWNVPARAWEMLSAARPDIAAGLQVIEASGKLAYGRRRG